MTGDANIIKQAVCLCDVGGPSYAAVTAVAADGSTHLVIAERDSLGEDGATYDAACSGVRHEQLGPLPLEFVRRLTISRRTHRCGRPTQAGRPCRIRVTLEDQACEWHRLKVDG